MKKMYLLENFNVYIFIIRLQFKRYKQLKFRALRILGIRASSHSYPLLKVLIFLKL